MQLGNLDSKEEASLKCQRLPCSARHVLRASPYLNSFELVLGALHAPKSFMFSRAKLPGKKGGRLTNVGELLPVGAGGMNAVRATKKLPMFKGILRELFEKAF